MSDQWRLGGPLALAVLAGRQGGLFTRSQAVECGFSTGQIRSRVACARWHRVVGDVFSDRAGPVDLELLDRAAQLAVPGSVLAGPSAARRWRMGVRVGGCHLAAGRRVRLPLAEVWVQVGVLADDDLAIVDCQALTSPGRTVFDCLRVLPVVAGAALLERSIAQGWTTVAAIARRAGRSVGLPGSPRVVRLLRAAAGGAGEPCPHTLSEQLKLGSPNRPVGALSF